MLSDGVITLFEWSDGAGRITFGPVSEMYGWYARTGWPPPASYAEVPYLELRAHAAQVYDVVRGAQQALSAPVNPGAASNHGGIR
jgi:hypothetical protein